MPAIGRALDQLARDSRHAFRAFAKHPGFTLTAALTIGLGMGFNTTLFTAMYGVMFRPLPVTDPGSLRNIYTQSHGLKDRSSYGSSAFSTFEEFRQIRAGSSTAEVAGIASAEVTWRGVTSRSIQAQLVSDNLLPLIGARPTVGRFFTRDEAVQPGSAAVAVLSHRFWRLHLGERPGVVGSTITLNRTPFTVIGVADETTRGPLIQGVDVWIPLTMQRLTRPGESLVDDPHAAWIQLFARTAHGATDADVLAEIRVLAHRAVAAGDTGVRTTVTVVPASYLNLPDAGSVLVPVLSLIWLAFGMILIVACANVANMLLARGLARQREIAVRLAIGADRRRLLQQLLTESGWLGLLGGAIGLTLALGAGRVVTAVLPAGLDLQFDFSPDRSVLAFAAVVSLLSGLTFGLLPALQAVRVDLTPGLKAEGLLATGRPRLRTQNLLVGLQVAVSVVLLVNAGLVVRSFNRALTMDVGKPLDHLLIGSFDLRQQQYTPEQGEAFFRRLNDRVAAMPGVQASGVSILNPELDAAQSLIRLDSTTAADQSFSVSFDEVGAGYFGAAGLRVLAGRTFSEDEVRRDDPVMVIDQRFADQHLHGQPIGQRIPLRGGPAGPGRTYEIIGVVNSTRPVGLAQKVLPTYFVPIKGLRYLEAKLWVRYQADAGPTLAAVRQAVTEVDPEVTAGLGTIEANVTTALLPVRIASWSLSALGLLALALASIGLFGVIAFSVGRRTREIAIRMALGAAPRRVLGLVVRQGLGPVAVGTGIGLVLAVGGGYLIRAVLYGLSPFDPVAIGGVIAAVAAGSALAFWIPARRATAIQPGSALRGE